MGKPGSYSNITATECESILDLIQKDFEARQREHEKLSKIQEEITELTAQRNVLSKRKEFNEKNCILCCSSFNLLFRRKIQCHDCHFWICRSCASWENNNKTWICEVCEKQRILDAESWSWFYNRIKTNFNQFGSAKVLENLCRRRRTSDSENDSGYGPTSEFKPLLSLFRSDSRHSATNMADSAPHDGCDDDDDEGEMGEEEEETEIHHSIETIVEGLLGSTLDDASVDRVYINSPLYDKIFSMFHGQLIEAIRNLSQSLQRALHNIPHDNDITPTAAHAALKRLISALVRECQDLPFLQLPIDSEMQSETDSITMKDVDIFSSYEGLVASAIINKVVEDNQSKFIIYQDNLLQKEVNSEVEKESYNRKESEKGYNENTEKTSNFSVLELPLEYVQIEEVEEITREYTDSEDDKFSSISHQSSGLHSIDELGMHREDSELDLLSAIDPDGDGKVPFPEFGRDLVDVDKADDGVCHPTAVTSWEENWLFRKKKRVPLYSNLKYQLLTYCDEPPCMLIPCPSESTDTMEPDELSSELSESHSVGSLEFSSDSDGQKSDDKMEHGEPALVQIKDRIRQSENLSWKHKGENSVPITLPKLNNTLEKQIQQDRCKQSDVSLIPETKVKYHYQEKKVLKDVAAHVGNETSKENENAYVCLEPSKEPEEKKCSQDNLDDSREDIFRIPPRPGTIAEREHQKWQNAVPLKNNPYSAENISKRFGKKPKTIMKESSFEEFERNLNDSMDLRNKQPVQKRLDCGLKSIDGNLYKRDYYVHSFHQNGYERNSQYKSLPNLDCCMNDNYDGIPEEALNSLEEKVYISSGKVFTLENHFKRLERELKDSSLSSSEGHSLQSTFQYNTQQKTVDVSKGIIDQHNSSDDEDGPSLPSVKTLATKFTPTKPEIKLSLPPEKPVPLPRKSEGLEKIKKSRPCMKVHSLTARSLSREFRDLARQNLPKPMNRMVTAQGSDDAGSERENTCSPASVPSPIGTTQQEISHGYTSDESSTSTSSLPRPKIRRHISRSILQRASYWERRAEQGLLSDASVSEEFPGLDITPD